MILKRTNHPSVTLSTFWTLITPYQAIEYRNVIQKHNKVTKETTIVSSTSKDTPVFYKVNQVSGDFVIVEIEHSQKLKMIEKYMLESIFGYIQLKGKKAARIPNDDIDDFLLKVIKFTGITRNQRTLDVWKRNLRRLQNLEITVKYHLKDTPEDINTLIFEKGRYISFKEDVLEINLFRLPEKMDKTKVKKYLFYFEKSEKLYHLMDFMLLKVQQRVKNKSRNGNEFYYRNFSLDTILEYFGLLEDYNQNLFLSENGIEEASNRVKNIKDYFTRMLKRLNQYSEIHGYEFPRYKLKGNMFVITDRCLKPEKTQKQLLEDIYETVTA